MSQRYEVFFALDELLFKLIAKRLHVPEPCSEAAIVAIGRSLECVEFSSFEEYPLCG
jgi:hypothetical protein